MLTALVTGSSDPLSLGFAIAKGLAPSHRIFLTARSDEAGQHAVKHMKSVVPDCQVDYLKLELTQDDQVRDAVTHVGERLDVLVNNASLRVAPDRQDAFRQAQSGAKQEDHDTRGLLIGSQLVGDNQMLDLTPPALLDMMDTNVCGSLRMVNAFLPALLKSDAPRIVNVSSLRGSLTFQSQQSAETQGIMAYAMTKATLNMLTIHQSMNLVKLKPSAKVNACCPGHAKTRFVQVGTLPLEDGAAVAVWLATLPNDGPTATFWQARPAHEVEADGYKPLDW